MTGPAESWAGTVSTAGGVLHLSNSTQRLMVASTDMAVPP
jgi:hypothetical protein